VSFRNGLESRELVKNTERRKEATYSQFFDFKQVFRLLGRCEFLFELLNATIQLSLFGFDMSYVCYVFSPFSLQSTLEAIEFSKTIRESSGVKSWS
jgi:hypothetical protein